MNCNFKIYREIDELGREVRKRSIASDSSNNAECVCERHRNRYCVDNGICNINPAAPISYASPVVPFNLPPLQHLQDSSFSDSDMSSSTRPAESKSNLKREESENVEMQMNIPSYFNTNIHLLSSVPVEEIVSNPLVERLHKFPNFSVVQITINGLLTESPFVSSFEKQGIPKINVIKLPFSKTGEQITYYTWSPYQLVKWSTDDNETASMIAWSDNQDRQSGKKGLAPDVSGCVMQTISAASHNFKIAPVLVADEQTKFYTAASKFKPGNLTGSGGNMEYTTSTMNAIRMLDSSGRNSYFALTHSYLDETLYPLCTQNVKTNAFNIPNLGSIELFHSFMSSLFNNNLILLNSKFPLTCRWKLKQIDGNGKPIFDNQTQQPIVIEAGHAQIISYYLESKTNKHVFAFIDTQKSSATKQTLISEGKGSSFLEALTNCCKNLSKSQSIAILGARKFGVVCLAPQVLIDDTSLVTIRQMIITGKGGDASSETVRMIQHFEETSSSQISIERQLVASSSAARADPYEQTSKLSVGLTTENPPRLLISSYNPQDAEMSIQKLKSNDFKIGISNDASENVIWVDVMNMQHACFNSVGKGGNVASQMNPLLISGLKNGIWFVYIAKKRSESRSRLQEDAALGSLLMMPHHTNSNGSLSILSKVPNGTWLHDVFTNLNRVPILEIWNVCSTPEYRLRGVCQTLLSQSMITQINSGTRAFYLGVRISTINSNKEINMDDLNIGAIKCYLKVGFKFILSDSDFWPLHQERQALLSLGPQEFMAQLKRNIFEKISNRIIITTTQQEQFGSEIKNVLYGHMFCAVWPFQSIDTTQINQSTGQLSYYLPDISSLLFNLPVSVVRRSRTAILNLFERHGYTLEVLFSQILNHGGAIFKNAISKLMSSYGLNIELVIQSLQILLQNSDSIFISETISVLSSLLQHSTSPVIKKDKPRDRGGKRKHRRKRKTKRKRKHRRKRKTKKRKQRRNKTKNKKKRKQRRKSKKK